MEKYGKVLGMMWHLNWSLKENGGFWKVKKTEKLLWVKRHHEQSPRSLNAHGTFKTSTQMGWRKVQMISLERWERCFRKFTLDFVNNGEPWFIFENRVARKDRSLDLRLSILLFLFSNELLLLLSVVLSSAFLGFFSLEIS